MRSHLRIVVLLALPVLLPGCLFFGRDRLDTVVEDEVCVPSLTS